MKTVFNYQEQVKELAATAHKGSGLDFELYQKRYNHSIDRLLVDAPKELKPLIIEMAKVYGYTDEDEQHSQPSCDGVGDDCCHGYDIDCCPHGCADDAGCVPDLDHEPQDYKDAIKIEAIADEMTEAMKSGKSLNPALWTKLKLFMLQSPDSCKWYCQFELVKGHFDDYRQSVNYLKQKLLNARFEFRLNKRIEEAKQY